MKCAFENTMLIFRLYDVFSLAVVYSSPMRLLKAFLEKIWYLVMTRPARMQRSLAVI